MKWAISAEVSQQSSRPNTAASAKSGATQPSVHIPYRASILTFLLRDSLGGNAFTTMIASNELSIFNSLLYLEFSDIFKNNFPLSAISPSSSSYNETVSTLRYASRTQVIKNKPVKNEDPQIRLIKDLKNEVDRLKKMLGNKVNIHLSSNSENDRFLFQRNLWNCKFLCFLDSSGLLKKNTMQDADFDCCVCVENHFNFWTLSGCTGECVASFGAESDSGTRRNWQPDSTVGCSVGQTKASSTSMITFHVSKILCEVIMNRVWVFHNYEKSSDVIAKRSKQASENS